MDERIKTLLYTRSDASIALQISFPVLDFYLNREEHPIPSIRVGAGKEHRKVLIPVNGLQEWISEEVERQAAQRKEAKLSGNS